MVTRKPVPPTFNGALDPLHSNPPYPVTPVTATAPPAFRLQDAQNEFQAPADSEPTTSHAWSGEGFDSDEPVQHTSEQPRTSADIPESLRPGQRPGGYTPKSSQENLTKPAAVSNNPFLKQQYPQGEYDGGESSAHDWGGSTENLAPPSQAPPPPPVPTDTPPSPPLSHQFSNLWVSEQSTNPWQPALDEKSAAQQPPIPSLKLQDSGDDAWSMPPPERHAPTIPESSVSNEYPVVIDGDGDDSPAWDENDSSSGVYELPAAQGEEEPQQLHEDQHAWDGLDGTLEQKEADVNPSLSPEAAVPQIDGWNIVEHETVPQSSQQSGIVGAEGTEIETTTIEEQAPSLPPRPQEEPPPQPPRPVVTAPPETHIAAAKSQKKETYDIKKITWYDITAEKNPRTSPILVQNANGPCPLLALVNALTLSTPANVETALVETLRSREQVSLGLLLDAVFDELMSGRRGDAAQELPDVSDLYAFLITLHTGMNVNPAFLPPAPTRKANDPRRSMSHVHPSEREDTIPGTFEETREMKLYSTFSIPLIHGWLPDKESPAYVALSRSAKTYEDAQNLMFREEDLEEKLQTEGLSFEEQATLEDIATIKAFLSTAATQLTQHGLNTITTSVAPAGVAILFRNDHFSTLYRHPETLQLLQLVTDMGYAGHEEVVWESLIDVNGENADFFSGDFCLVSGTSSAPSQSGETPSWNTVAGRAQGHQSQPSASSAFRDPEPSTPMSPNTEQEDHDMALALQLQEEEEERHRNEIERRKRETQLSQQYIEQQGSQSNVIPVSQRGGGSGRGRNRGQNRATPEELRQLRPAVPPRPGANGRPIDPEAGVDAPPPSYEQAATTPAYVPPPDHPAHPSADPNAARRSSSAYSANSGVYAGQGSVRGGRMSNAGRGRGGPLIDQIPGRRQSAGVQQQERDRDCVVM